MGGWKNAMEWILASAVIRELFKLVVDIVPCRGAKFPDYLAQKHTLRELAGAIFLVTLLSNSPNQNFLKTTRSIGYSNMNHETSTREPGTYRNLPTSQMCIEKY